VPAGVGRCLGRTAALVGVEAVDVAVQLEVEPQARAADQEQERSGDAARDQKDLAALLQGLLAEPATPLLVAGPEPPGRATRTTRATRTAGATWISRAAGSSGSARAAWPPGPAGAGLAKLAGGVGVRSGAARSGPGASAAVTARTRGLAVADRFAGPSLAVPWRGSAAPGLSLRSALASRLPAAASALRAGTPLLRVSVLGSAPVLGSAAILRGRTVLGSGAILRWPSLLRSATLGTAPAWSLRAWFRRCSSPAAQRPAALPLGGTGLSQMGVVSIVKQLRYRKPVPLVTSSRLADTAGIEDVQSTALVGEQR
jgi:hypothetical protein